MNRCLVVLFLLLVCMAVPAKAQVSLVTGIELQVERLSPSGVVTVDVVASPEKALRIWDSENSWGAATWRVLVVRNGRIESFFQSPLQIFTVNMPRYTEIAKGGRVTVKLDLNSGNWCGLGYCSRWDQRGFGGQQASF